MVKVGEVITIVDAIERGKRTWFAQDPAALAPILGEFEQYKSSCEDWSATQEHWLEYFNGVLQHYSKHHHEAADTFIKLETRTKDADPLLRALIARNIAVIGNMRHDQDPFTALEAALQLSLEADDDHTSGTIYFNLGITANRFDRREQALSSLDKARECFDACDDKMGVFETIHWRTQVLSVESDHEEVVRLIDALQEMAQDIGNPRIVVEAGLKKSFYYFECGQYREALASFERTLSNSTELKVVENLSFIQFGIAITYKAMSESGNAIKWAEKSLETARASNLPSSEINASTVLVLANLDLGKLEVALGLALKVLALSEDYGNPAFAIECVTAIGDIYYAAGDAATAREWYERAERLLYPGVRDIVKANIYCSTLNVYIDQHENEMINETAAKLIEVLPKINLPANRARILVLLAQYCVSIGDVRLAEEMLAEVESMDLLKESPEIRVASLKPRTLIHESRGDIEGAIAATYERIRLSQKHKLKHQELDANEDLLKLFKVQRDIDLFFDQYELVDSMREEVKSTQQHRQMTLTSLELDHEKERQHNVAREQLLNNVLPTGIAERILGGETIIADDHDDVAVIFLDIVSFTDLASAVPPGHVIHLLNSIFQLCDEVMRAHSITKIKTIGDAYLAVAGAPRVAGQQSHVSENTANAARAVMDLLKRLETLEVTMPPDLGDTDWISQVGDISVRIGCHVGSVVAGVVGVDRVAYDVWGDAVNVAARMEQTSEPGRIQISDDFARSLPGAGRPEFDTNDRVVLKTDIAELVQRGNIPIKGKGDMKTWWLK